MRKTRNFLSALSGLMLLALLALTLAALFQRQPAVGPAAPPVATATPALPENRSPYPYPTNPATVPIETDYLLDVVPQEMGPYYHPTAIQALAIAARSYIMYKINNNFSINNSTSLQVFIPYKFESLNSNDQQIIQDAVAPRYYIAPADTDEPAFAEHFADILNGTVSGDEPYLLGIGDPISEAYMACDANDDGHGRGLSQEGASRWARGNKCSYAGAGDQPWSVEWDDVRQILVHYYTGIHLRDANNNNTITFKSQPGPRSSKPIWISQWMVHTPIPLQLRFTASSQSTRPRLARISCPLTGPSRTVRCPGTSRRLMNGYGCKTGSARI